MDCQCYTLDMLEKDLTARINWGRSQQLVVSEFDMSRDGERKLLNDTDLSIAFAEGKNERKMFWFVAVVDKPTEIISYSVVSEAAISNVAHDDAIPQSDFSNDAVVSHEIDWDSLEIIPLTADQIGAPFPVIDEDTVYEFLGLRAEDERAEEARAAVVAKENPPVPIDLDPTDELLVDDHVPGEDSVLYDREDPPMKVGTVYASMPEFRATVRHHAIMK